MCVSPVMPTEHWGLREEHVQRPRGMVGLDAGGCSLSLRVDTSAGKGSPEVTGRSGFWSAGPLLGCYLG